MTIVSDLPVDEIRLSDPELWKAPDEVRDAVFAKLRAERPISYQDEPEYEAPMPIGPGFWALTRHHDIWIASRNPDVFCSGRGSNIGDMPVEIAEFFGSMIAMDAPKHTATADDRAEGFTPKVVAAIEEDVRRKAKAIVDEHAALGEGDFVQLFAAPLPLQLICEMMGIPRDEWADGVRGDEHHPGVSAIPSTSPIWVCMGAAMEMFQMA